jgi:two-component system OmpR family sensor kinase
MTLLRGRAPWTLRRRLVVSVVALFTLLSIVVGGFSILALNNTLLAPANQQLERSVGFLENRAGAPSGGGTPLPGGGTGGGFNGAEPGSITVTKLDSSVSGRQSAQFHGSARTLDAAQLKSVQSVTESDTARDITVPGLGNYRVIRTKKITLVLSNADGTISSYTAYFWFGYPLAQSQNTLTQFGLTLGSISLLGILLVALATWFLVSFALRPLRRVAATATEVASMELDRGDVDLSVRSVRHSTPCSDTSTTRSRCGRPPSPASASS